MFGALPFPLPGVSSRRLVSAGRVSPLVTFSRSQTAGALATNRNTAGTWVEVPENTPRIFGANEDLLIEPQRTNAVRNPRMEGGAVGAIGGAGAWPQFFEVVNNNFAGFTATINSFQKTDGVDTMTFTLTATSTTDNIFVLAFESSTSIVTAPSSPAALGMFLRVDAVSGDIRTYGFRAQPRTAAGAVVAGAVAASAVDADSTFRRFTANFPASLPGWDNATIARLQPNLYVTCGVGVAASVTLTLGWPSTEVGVLGATSPVLPPVGAPAASTRGADIFTAPVTSPATVLLSGELVNLSTGAAQCLVDLSDGTASNRVALRTEASHPSISGTRVIGGTATSVAALTEVAVDAPVAVALSVDADGAVRMQARGQEPQTVAAGAIPLTSLRVGGNAAGGEQATILVRELRVLPFAVDTSGATGLQTLLAPQRLLPPLSLNRVQVLSRSTFRLPDGVTWLEGLADEPRFEGAAQRLMIGGQRTNSIGNPRFEGGIAGSPGTLPTNAGSNSIPTGIVRTLTTGLVFNGMQGVRLRWEGTPTATATNAVYQPVGAAIIAALQGQSWTSRLFYRVTAGGLGGLSAANHFLINRNAGGSGLGSGASQAINASGALIESTVTITPSDPTTAFVQPDLRLGFQAGQAMLLEIEIYWWTCEQGAFASTPVLPPAGTPAVSTRSADVIAPTLASLGVPASGACTFLFRGVLTNNAPAGVAQILLQLDDGSDTNRYQVRNAPGGATIVAGRVAAGVSADATSLGSMTAGGLFTVAVSINGSGRIAASLNGGTVQAQTGGVTAGLTTFRVGNNVAGSAPAFCEIERLMVLPGVAASDGQLQAWSAALPDQSSARMVGWLAALPPAAAASPVIGVLTSGQSRAAMHVGGTPVFVSGDKLIKEPNVLMLETPGMPSAYPFEDKFYRDATTRLRPLMDNPSQLPGHLENRKRTLGQSMSGAARYLARRDRERGAAPRHLLHMTLGTGGTRVDQHLKNAGLFVGAWASFVLHDRESEAIYMANRRTRAQRGVLLDVRYYMWLQGANDITAGTSAATYVSRLLSLFASRRADIMGITGQAVAPFILIEQETAYGINNPQSGPIQNAQADLHGGNGGLDVVVGPAYWLPFRDTGHYSAIGVELNSERFGWWIEQFETTGSWPLLLDIVSHQVVGNDIILTFRDTGTALQWDTTTVPSATNMGFSIFSGGVSITSVTLGNAASRTVVITCSGNPTGVTLDYATRGPGNNLGATGYAEGYGNLRDGRAVASILQPGQTLYPGFALARRRVI